MRPPVVISMTFFVCGLHAQLKNPNAPQPTTPIKVEISEEKVVLHKDLEIVLRSKQGVSTRTNKIGDTLEFEVIRPVMAGDLVVVAKGATATGKIVESQRSGRMGKGGGLRIDVESVQLVTGEKLPLVSHVDFDAGYSGSMDRAAMIGFAGFLVGSLQKGQEAQAQKGSRMPAWVAADVSIPLADLRSSQPAPQPPRTDAGSIYLFMDATTGPSLEAKFLIGEAHYFVPSSLAVRIDVPPGDYWVRTGRAAKNDKFGKEEAAGLFHIALKAGDSCYITAEPDSHDRYNALLRTLAPADGEEHVEKSEVLFEYPLANRPEEVLRRLRAQPIK